MAQRVAQLDRIGFAMFGRRGGGPPHRADAGAGTRGLLLLSLPRLSCCRRVDDSTVKRFAGRGFRALADEFGLAMHCYHAKVNIGPG